MQTCTCKPRKPRLPPSVHPTRRTSRQTCQAFSQHTQSCAKCHHTGAPQSPATRHELPGKTLSSHRLASRLAAHQTYTKILSSPAHEAKQSTSTGTAVRLNSTHSKMRSPTRLPNSPFYPLAPLRPPPNRSPAQACKHTAVSRTQATIARRKHSENRH